MLDIENARVLTDIDENDTETIVSAQSVREIEIVDKDHYEGKWFSGGRFIGWVAAYSIHDVWIEI